jgi:hypothetical protein
LINFFSQTNTEYEVNIGTAEIEEQENYATYTLENFVADLGGIIGLFLGFSILSLIELIFVGAEKLFKYFESR